MSVPADIARAALGHIARPALGDSYFARAEAAILRCETLAMQLECVMRSGRQCVCVAPRKAGVKSGGAVCLNCGDRC